MKYTKLILDERMIVPEPKIRLEFFLHAIVTGEQCELVPKTVDEEYLYAIASGDTSRMSEIYPRTLVEIYYDAILNNSVEDLPTPRTRWEEFLRSAVTKEPCELEPETSLEIYLSQISSNGGFDYIVSTSTNSTIISLPNSINGIIKSIEMDGNTLVNYCTNGSEELTLNNETNVQGTNVTLTDTVDVGKVDVVCEGNTLVNLNSKSNYQVHSNTIKRWVIGEKLKPNTTYTIITNISDEYLICCGYNASLYVEYSTPTEKIKFTTGATLLQGSAGQQCSLWVKKVRNEAIEDSTLLDSEVMLLEGDYTNKPTPSYFEGMKSVGECEDNKIEIISSNIKQVSKFENGGYGASDEINNTDSRVHCKEYIEVSNDTNYNIKLDSNIWCEVRFYNNSKQYISNMFWLKNGESFTTPSNCKFIRVAFRNNTNTIISANHIKNFTIGNLNKKEIQLSEPLRGLPNGVCDKFVKQGGKWYVERNCGEVRVKKSMSINIHNTNSTLTNFCVRLGSQYIARRGCISNILLEDNTMMSNGASVEGFFIDANNKEDDIYIRKLTSNCANLNSFYNYLDDVDLRFVVELATPTYEEITDPQVITYLDTTHISINSTIPCNIQVKNSGYNAIIKPSTQYTVAFDTNTSGEVGINLGGAKVTTTNNVATITTPSALTDDTLRLYGKGIKASKIRLLEGDKTNYIPSYFEGMKSCFEDKEQDNGNYEVEIMSQNKNLLSRKNINQGGYAWSNGVYHAGSTNRCCTIDYIKVKAGERLYRNKSSVFFLYDKDFNYIGNGRVGFFGSGTYTTNSYLIEKNVKYINIVFSGTDYGNNPTDSRFDDAMISYSPIENYVDEKHNKIQLQLNEPLRAVGDVKDRFVLRDGKLMIERNCGEIVFDGSKDEEWRFPSSPDASNRLNISVSNCDTKYLICDKLKTVPYSERFSHTNCILPYTDSTIRVCNIDNVTNIDELRAWLKVNPITVGYILIKPTYKEVPTSQRLTCYENATLFIDTNITPTHVEIEYPTEKQQLFRIK